MPLNKSTLGLMKDYFHDQQVIAVEHASHKYAVFLAFAILSVFTQMENQRIKPCTDWKESWK